MTTEDIFFLCAKLVSVWSLGFTGGFLLTKFREAMNHVT